MRIFRAIIILSMSCLTLGQSYAQVEQTQTDQSAIDVRTYDTDKIEELKKDKDFSYTSQGSEPPGFFQRIWNFIQDLISRIIGAATNTTFGKILLYVLGAVLIVICIIKIFQINVREVFYGRSDVSRLNFEELEDQIDTLDFEKLLQEAIQNQDFRLAVRLVYLRTLKALSDTHLIDWAPGKTNYEYLNELKGDALQNPFRELSYYFDYAWYGDFEVDEVLYDKATARYNTIGRSIPQIPNENE